MVSGEFGNRQRAVADNVPDVGRLAMNKFRPKLNWNKGTTRIQRMNASADTFPRFQDQAVDVSRCKCVGGRQTGDSGTDNKHVGRSIFHSPTQSLRVASTF